MSKDIIRRSLGIDDVEESTEINEVVTGEIVEYDDGVESENTSFEYDFDYAVNNIKELIDQGKEAIDELLVIAKQSQHPRAYEVIATLLKETAKMNSDIIDAHKKKVDINPNYGGVKAAKITNNNLFVGSTAELQKMLEDLKEKNNVEEE